MIEEVSEEMLMALADGELDAETTRRLQARLAAEPQLRARYARYTRSAEAVRAVFADVMAEPPPERLADAIRNAADPDTAVVLGRRWDLSGWGALPLAATVALAAGLGFLLGQGTDSSGADSPDALNGLRIAAEALADHETGEVVELADGSRAAVIASFDTATGACRHFQTRAADGQVWESLGCRGATGWDIALVLPQTDPGGYVPAEGAGPHALDAYLTGLAASAPLDPATESARIRDGWAPGE